MTEHLFGFIVYYMFVVAPSSRCWTSLLFRVYWCRQASVEVHYRHLVDWNRTATYWQPHIYKESSLNSTWKRASNISYLTRCIHIIYNNAIKISNISIVVVLIGFPVCWCDRLDVKLKYMSFTTFLFGWIVRILPGCFICLCVIFCFVDRCLNRTSLVS